MTDKRTIIVAGYDPTWPQIFTELAAVIAQAIGSLAVRIEHVGSTSVPGLAAKPIIDIDIVIENRDTFPDLVARLDILGYRHQGNLGIADREAFARTGDDVPRDGSGREWLDHHLYVCPSNGLELSRHLRLRDALRHSPILAYEYGALKQALAANHPHDIDAYVDGKSAFIEAILASNG